MYGLPRTAHLRSGTLAQVVACVCVLWCSAGRAQTTAPLRLHGLDATLAFRGSHDEQRSRLLSGASAVSQSRPVFEQELFVVTHSSVYHPNLLSIDAGGGVTFVQERYEAPDGRVTAQSRFWSALARATLLGQKPFPASAWYERTRRAVPLTSTERFFITESRAGARASLLQPITPVPVQVEAQRHVQDGSGFGERSREDVRSVTLRASRVFSTRGSASLQYDAREQTSLSESPRRAARSLSRVTHSADGMLAQTFGRRGRVDAQLTGSWYRQQDAPRREITRVVPEIRWRPSPQLTMTGRYRRDLMQVDQRRVTRTEVEGIASHQLYLSLTSRVEGHTNASRGVDVFEERTGGGVQLAYRKRTIFGSVGASYVGAYELNDRRSSGGSAPVVGESITLRGLAGEELRGDDVVAGSVEVWNAERTRRYTEGIDYRLTVSGRRTRIDRVPTGSIPDGEPLVVDYVIALAGTFRFQAVDHTYSASASWRSAVTVYARYRHAPRRLLAGRAPQPLNSADDESYGVQWSLPLPLDHIEVEGTAEMEHHAEDLAPFDRRSATASVHIAPLTQVSLTANAERVVIDNTRSVEDIDLWAGSLVADAGVGARLRVSAEARGEQDTGSSVERRVRSVTARGVWTLRQLTMEAGWVLANERYGVTDRTRLAVRAEVRRVFAR